VCNGGQLRIKERGVTKRTLQFSGFLGAEHKLLLSGMPTPEGELDLYEQFNFLWPGWLGCNNFYTFRSRYFELGWDGYSWRPKKGTTKLLQDLMHEMAFCLRRTEAGVHLPKVYEKRVVELPAAWAKTYRDTERDYAFGETETKWELALQTWLARMAAGFSPEKPHPLESSHKLKELEVLLQGELSQEQVVVWCHFLREVEEVEGLLERLKVSSVSVTGAVSQSKREHAIHNFQRGQAQVFIAQVRCARYGLNCACADTAIYFGNEWSLETRMQSEDRILHPGKTTPVLIVDLVTRNTVEEDVQQVLRNKRVEAVTFMRDLRGVFNKRVGGVK
jgi:SNF2 family DNA or RNA helicase